jgi:hypothetical protein
MRNPLTVMLASVMPRMVFMAAPVCALFGKFSVARGCGKPISPRASHHPTHLEHRIDTLPVPLVFQAGGVHEAGGAVAGFGDGAAARYSTLCSFAASLSAILR